MTSEAGKKLNKEIDNFLNKRNKKEKVEVSTNSSFNKINGDSSGIILPIAAYYAGKHMGWFWLWKTAQIILYIYGALISILLMVLVFAIIAWIIGKLF